MRFLPGIGPLGRRLGLGILLGLFALPVAAQIGPISTQSLFLNQSSNAHPGNYLEAEAGLMYTDNVNLTPGGPGDGIALIGLVGDTSRVGAPRFDYHLDSDLALAKYFKSEYSTQPYGYLDAFGEFKIAPGTLSWTARYSYSQALINSVNAPTPDNLASYSYITTGPRLTLRPTLRTTIVIDGSYSYVDSNSNSPDFVNVNNHRLGADLRIDRAFTNTFSAYLTGSYYKVQFTDTTTNTDFDLAQGLAGIRFSASRTVLDLAAGYNRAQTQGTPSNPYPTPRGALLGSAPVAAEAATTPSSNVQNPSGSTWQASLSRLISPTKRLSLHASKQVTDGADLFRLNLDQPVPGNQPKQIITGQPLTYRDYGGTFSYDTGRTAVTLNAVYYSDHYSQTPQSDHDARQLNALVARQLSPVLNGEFAMLYEHDNYTGYTQHTWEAITSLRWQVGARIGLRFFYAYSSISSPNGYTDNQIGVIASYALSTAATKSAAATMQPTAPASQPYH